jgi:hypothetical protein
MIRILLAFLAAWFMSAPGSAAEGKTIDALDFMVDWPKMIGQTVRVTGGKVWGAGLSRAYLSAPGGNVDLDPPWLDREDLRYIFRNCTSSVDSERCALTVIGTVQRDTYRVDEPRLVGVDFEVPSQ